MTVGFFSPMPPARTGVADYSAALFDAMRRLGDIELAPARCAIGLYHLGNNALHAAVYRRALQQPGVAVLHDATLHHFLLGALPEAAYLDEFAYNYGEWNRPAGAALWRERARSASDPRYFRYGMLKRIAARSRAVVVHNPAAAEAVRSHVPGAAIVEIPHLYRPAPAVAIGDAIRYRQKLGIDPAAYLFGVFGYLRESKRVSQIVEAFAHVRRDLPRVALLLAGDFVSTDLERAVAPFFKMPGIVRRPFLPEAEFRLAAAAVDACINLKYPAAGETSGIAIRLMGLGKPALLSDAAEASRFPRDACIRIPVGTAERASLEEHMRLLAAMPAVGPAIGERAAAHIAARHRLECVAAEYWRLLRDCARTLLT